jgi:flagellar M-ring protein FliF
VPVEVLTLSSNNGSHTLSNSQSITPELLNELIRQKPGNIGVALRNWVAEPASKN